MFFVLKVETIIRYSSEPISSITVIRLRKELELYYLRKLRLRLRLRSLNQFETCYLKTVRVYRYN